jgi:hypothetical protein
MRNIFNIIAGIIWLCIFLFSCAPNSGNGTLTGNPAICGRVFQADGSTAAKNAVVYLRDKNALIDISSIGEISGIAITQTDKNGFFEIDSVGNGTYTIECTDGKNNYALYDSVTVNNNQETVHLPADTLKPAGAIKGRIILPEGGDPSNVYALAFGVDRFSICDTSGKFKLKNISEGTYSLRFVSSLSGYGTYDTTNIHVTSGDTSDIGVIELPYTDIPLLKNVALTLDTMKEIVTITWDSIDASRINGYNLYKKMANDSGFKKCNQTSLQQPFFIDSLVETNKTYSYRVCTFNKDSTEGVKTKPCSVTVVNSHVQFLEEFSNIRMNYTEGKRCVQKTFVTSSTNFLWVIFNDTVKKCDTNFNEILRIKNDFLEDPFEVAAGNNGRVYVSDRHSGELHNIYVFNDDGSLYKSIKIYEKDSLTGLVSGIGIRASLFSVNNREQLAIVNITKDTVYMFDTSGRALGSIAGFGNGGVVKFGEGVSQVQFDNADNIYITDFEVGIKVYDSSMNFKKMVSFSEYTFPYLRDKTSFGMLLSTYGIYIDQISGLILSAPAITGLHLYVFDLNGNFISRITVGGPGPFLMVRNQTNLFISVNPGVKKYKFEVSTE